MELSIIIGIASVCRESKKQRDPVEMITMLHEAGFRHMDYVFGEEKNEDFTLRGDDWQHTIDRVADTAAKLGITFTQSHLPYIKGADQTEDPSYKNPGYAEYFDEMMRRAYIASSMLGVKYATAHPLSAVENLADADRHLQINHEYYDRFVEQGIKLGVGTAFENMRPGSPGWKHPYRFAQNVDDLILLADSYHDPMVGTCWDTGHAIAAKQNQRQAINKMGYRLRNLHINDSEYGMRDEHLLPFMSKVDWADFIEGLIDVNYQGVLNYEVGKVAKNAPADFQPRIFKTVYANGMALLEMYGKALADREKEGAR